MTNRDLLKEAIADAKAVKEVAITNAKAALEEAFTPHLKEMFEKKMNEMELEEDEMKTEATETEMSERELEELLRELDDTEEPVMGAEDEDESEEDESEEESEEEEEDEVEVDLEEMTEEDLKKFIEEVVDEMIEAGELEAGNDGMEDEAGAMEEPSMGPEEAPAEEEMPVTEIVGSGLDFLELAQSLGVTIDQAKAIVISTGLSMPVILMMIKAGGDKVVEFFKKLMKKSSTSEMQDMTAEAHHDDKKHSTMEEELAEAMETINTLKSELNEINLLNSKLLYTNKIFKAKNLNEAQKVKVLTAFDKAESVKEVKLVFETLNEGLERASKKELVRESKGFASKTIGSSPKQPVVEVNPVFERMRKLAGL